MRRLLTAILLAHGSIACSSAPSDDTTIPEQQTLGENAQFLVDSDGSYEASGSLEEKQPEVILTLKKTGSAPIVTKHPYSPELSVQLPALGEGDWTVQVELTQKNQTALEATAAFVVKLEQFVRIQMRLRGFSGGYGTVALDVRVLDDETKWRAKQVAPGNFNSCVLSEEGTVFCWGRDYGDLPTQIVGFPGAPSGIFAGRDSTCAGLTGGGASCWGNAPDALPSLVMGLPTGDVTDMALGGQQNCAVANGDLYCWSGEIASWSTGSYAALKVEGLPKKVARVFNSQCNFTPNMCNAMHVLFDDGEFASVRIDFVTPATGPQIPGTATGTVEFVLAPSVDAAGTGTSMWCTSDRSADQTTVQCNAGLANPLIYSAVEAPEGAAVSVYHLFACAAVPTTSIAACWGHAGGDADYGSTAGYTYGDQPVPIAGIVGPISALRTGARHACAINHDGDLFCWGRNDLGQLGVGPTGPRYTNAVLVNRK